jgi:hypothetical protein
MSQELIVTRFDDLVRCNADYDEPLDATIDDEVTEAEYESEITGLFNNLPMAIKWVGSVEQALLPKLPRSDN